MNQMPMTRRLFQQALPFLAAGGAAALLAEDKPAAPASPAPAGASPETKAAPMPPAVDPAADPTAERDYPAPGYKPKRKRPRIGMTLVEDFVIFAHYDLDMVKRLLEKDANLLNATVDWGAGDWESALGAAAHMGQREIALYLIERGARLDIFAATMLGYLDVVKSLLTSHPQLLGARGPHGFTLLSHAKAGKEHSAEVLKYLEALQKEQARGEGAAPEKKEPATGDAAGKTPGGT